MIHRTLVFRGAICIIHNMQTINTLSACLGGWRMLQTHCIRKGSRMSTIENVLVVSPVVATQTNGDVYSQLVSARKIAVRDMAKGDISLGVYAEHLCKVFNVTDAQGKVLKPWYALQGKDKKAVTLEFKAFQADIQSSGRFADRVEYTYWGRLKDMSGRVKTTGKAAGEGTDEVKRTRAEIGTIINRINESGDEQLQEILELMREAYATIGGKLSDLRTEAETK